MRYEAAALVASATAPYMLDRRRQRISLILERCGWAMPLPARLDAGTPEAWAWVAGLLEGEGWICPSPQAKICKPIIGARSTDKDVLERLQDLTEVGSVYTVAPRKPIHKPSWQWSVSNRAPGGGRTLTPEGTGSWDQRVCLFRHQRLE
jgi:hypothetical protein